MLKLFNLHVSKITFELFLVESLLVLGALLVPAFVHFGTDPSNALIAEYRYLKIAAAAVVCVLLLYCNNLYSPPCINGSQTTYTQLLQALGAAAIVLAILYCVFPGMQICRGFSVAGVSLAGVLLISNRAAFLVHQETKKPHKPVLILGDGPMAKSIARSLEARADLGYYLAGYVGGVPISTADGVTLRHLGRTEELAAIAERIKPAELIVAMAEQRSKLPIDALLVLKTSGVAIRDAAEFYETLTGKLAVESIRPSSLIFAPGFRVSRLALASRRILSFALAASGLLILFPLTALIALAIRLDSPGPIVFRQRRVGFHGEHFTLYKFRTMHVNADGGGYARPAEHNDPRVTRVGRVLRRFRLDEIPQMYNILSGDMFFVGPRPFVPEQEMECAAQIPMYTFRWSVRPGATGWAQVQRGYCASLHDNTDKLAYDLFYIKNKSLTFDLLIILKTLKIVFSGHGGR